MGVWLRVFDPKGYRNPYKGKDWRSIHTSSKAEPIQPVRDHRVTRDVQPVTTKRPPPETQARVKAPEPGDETVDTPEPQSESLKPARKPSDVEKEITGRQDFYGPGELTGIAGDLMKTDYHIVDETTTISKVTEILKERPFDHFPVISGRKTICGLISKNQIFRKLAEGNMSLDQLEETEVKELMVTPVLCCAFETPIKSLIEAFISEGVGILPVVDSHDKLKGFVAKNDILEYIYESSSFFKG